MKPFLKPVGLVFILILVIFNAYFFIKTMSLGDGLLKMETETRRLKTENVELAAKLSSLNSLLHLQKLAVRLGFTKKQELLYLDNLKYALRYE